MHIKIIRFYLLAMLVLMMNTLSFAQNLDSLLIVAKNIKDDSVKIRMYNKIAFGFIFNDTDRALEIIKEGKELAKISNFKFGLTELTNTHGIYMDIKGQSDSASYYFEKALKMSRDFELESIESMCINNLGMFNWNRGNYEKALDFFFQSLKMDEARNSERTTATPLNNIGLIYQEMNLSEKALEYHKKAKAVREKYNLKNDLVASYNNIGINLKDLGRIDEAIEIYVKGISLAKAQNNRIDYYRLQDNLANAYYDKGDNQLALKTYLEAITNAEAYKGDDKGLLSSYNNIATLYNEAGNPNRAKIYVKKGLELIEKYPDIEPVAAELYLTGSETYYMLDNYEKARGLKKDFLKIKDAIFSEKNAAKMADLEVKYETEKKEKEILIQRAEIAEQGLIIQKRNYQIYGLIGLAFILVFIGYLLYNQQELKNRQLKKEKELREAFVTIETQNQLQEQRLRISRDLHDNIGAQLTFIISSIDNLKYGFDLNQKLDEKLSRISEFTGATIYELRDTIWAMNKNEITFEDLKIRITNFLDKAGFASQNVNFQFETDPTIENSTVFSSFKGMNIYRIIQEAVNNAIKYANAYHISVSCKSLKNTIEIAVVDDGFGFDINYETTGNGLNNMKKRASDIGADLTVNSSENGTQVQLLV